MTSTRDMRLQRDAIFEENRAILSQTGLICLFTKEDEGTFFDRLVYRVDGLKNVPEIHITANGINGLFISKP